MSITPERLRSVAFSDKYYATPARLIARKGTTWCATPAGMKGKRIGVQRATTHDRFATDTFKDSEIVRYTGQDQVFLDLQSGRLDAVLADQVAANSGLLKRPAGKDFALFGPAVQRSQVFRPGRRRGDAQGRLRSCRPRFNQAIKDIRANGTYEKIAKKYFDFDVYSAR